MSMEAFALMREELRHERVVKADLLAAANRAESIMSMVCPGGSSDECFEFIAAHEQLCAAIKKATT